MRIGAIILAAGSSRRFGDDKRKARLAGGKLVIQQAIENARIVFDEALLVLRHGDSEFQADIERLFFDPGLSIFKAPDSALGMGHSLANAVSQVDDWDGAFVFLADMPHIRKTTLERLKSTLASTYPQVPIVVPTFNGQFGHPVGFHSAYFEEISQLRGDTGAKPVIQRHESSVIMVPVEDAGVVVDIDVPSDLAE